MATRLASQSIVFRFLDFMSLFIYKIKLDWRIHLFEDWKAETMRPTTQVSVKKEAFDFRRVRLDRCTIKKKLLIDTI